MANVTAVQIRVSNGYGVVLSVSHFVCLFSSVLSDRSCLRVTAAPASLDVDANVQRTLDNNLATEAYERRIKRLEQEKLELSRKLQGKYFNENIFPFLSWTHSVRNCSLYSKWWFSLEKRFFLLSRKKLSCRNLCKIQYNIYGKVQN